MDPETLASEFGRLQEEQARLRDDARFLIEQADRLAEATEKLALLALATEQPPPPRRPPGRRASHRKGPETRRLNLKLIKGGVAAAVALMVIRRARLTALVHRSTWAYTAAAITAAAATGAAGAVVAVMVIPANPGGPAGPGVTISKAADTPAVHHARRRRRTAGPGKASWKPDRPGHAGPRQSSAPSPTPSPSQSSLLPSPLPTITVPPLPVPVPSTSLGPVCVAGICISSVQEDPDGQGSAWRVRAGETWRQPSDDAGSAVGGGR